MEKETVAFDYNNNTIVADITPKGAEPQIVCMHGAGNAKKELFDPLRQLFLEKNIFSVALDFMGHGGSGGDKKESSLKARTEQAQLCIEKVKAQQPLTLIGSSMSGYIAIKLTEIFPVGTLVLLSPGIYDKNAYEVPFSEEFSSIIRKEKSWENSDAWEILKKYKGKIIVVTGSDDEVVPFEIIQKIYDNATEASYREIIVIPGAPHRLLTVYFPEHGEELKKLAEKIIKQLK